MTVESRKSSKLSLAQKFSRLSARFRDPEWRRYGWLLLVGKATGVALVLLIITVVSGLFFSHVLAAEGEVKAADIVNPINTAWTLVAAFLVFGMQVGFTMLEAGFCRSRETVNVLMECVVDTCLCGVFFYAFGFAFMFSQGNGFIGYHWFFLQGAPATYETTGVAFLAVWIFQFAFADTCSTITSGAMIGRTGFVGDLIYSSAFPASSIRSSVTGRGVRMAGWPPWAARIFLSLAGNRLSMISPAPRSCTRSAGSSLSQVRSCLARASDAGSSATAAHPCCLTI